MGRRRLAIRLVAPKADNNEQDNIRDARYEVVGEKLKVLAVAGGPTREYRFVRNMLYRDNSIQLDAWLQTGQPGSARTRITSDEFPTAEELFQYDAIVMFDPDWMALESEQLQLLDRWLTGDRRNDHRCRTCLSPGMKRRRTDPRVAPLLDFTHFHSQIVRCCLREGDKVTLPGHLNLP